MMLFLFAFSTLSLLLISFLNCDPQCSSLQSNYYLQWHFHPQSDRVVFLIKSRIAVDNFMIGFAISSQLDNKSIKRFDYLGIRGSKGKLDVIDGYVKDDNSIVLDALANTETIFLNANQNIINAALARPLTTSDPFDADLSSCFTIHLPVNNTTFNLDANVDQKLSFLENVTVCDIFESCLLEQSSSTDKTVTSPIKLICGYNGNGFNVNWWFESETNHIVFDIKQKKVTGKRYTAIGFGDTMKALDIVIAFFEEGKLNLLGDFYSDQYRPPKKDTHQDLIVRQASIIQTENVESIWIQFSRPIITNDEKEDVSLDGCVKMNFLINGGKYGEKGQIEKHEFYPSYLTVCEMRRCLPSDLKNDKISNEYEKDYTPKLNIVLNDDYSTSTEKAVTLIQSENTEVPFSVTDMNVILKLDDFANVTDEPLGNETSSEMAVKEQHGCPLEHQDFSICKNYFNEYLASVSQWGKKYNRPVKQLYSRACALLSEVPYLSTACCTIFNETCTVHMKIIKNNNEIYI